MIKKFIKYNESFHEDIDPFGEENWNEDVNYEVGDKIMCNVEVDWYPFKKGEIYTIIKKNWSLNFDQMIYTINYQSGKVNLNKKIIDKRFIKVANESLNNELDPYGEEDEWGENTEFEIGEKVLCIRPIGNDFQEGEYYHISGKRSFADNDLIYKVMTNNGYNITLSSINVKKYFAKVTNESINSDIDPYGEENWEEIDFEKLFIEFLKEKGIYDKYNNNLMYRRFKEILLDDKPQRWISSAFNWDSTPEKFRFWSKISYEWCEIIDKYI